MQTQNTQDKTLEALLFIDNTAEDFEMDTVESAEFADMAVKYTDGQVSLNQFSEWLMDELQFNAQEVGEIIKRIDFSKKIESGQAATSDYRLYENASKAPAVKNAVPIQTPKPNPQALLEAIITPQTIAQRQTIIVEKTKDISLNSSNEQPTENTRKVDPYREPIE